MMNHGPTCLHYLTLTHLWFFFSFCMVSPCFLFESFAYNFTLANMLATGIAPQEVVFHNELHEQIAVIIHPFWNIWFFGMLTYLLLPDFDHESSFGHFGELFRWFLETSKEQFFIAFLSVEDPVAVDMVNCWLITCVYHLQCLIFGSWTEITCVPCFSRFRFIQKRQGPTLPPQKIMTPTCKCCMFWVKLFPHEMPWC